MDITLEWEGISGLIKIILLLSIIFFSGFLFREKD